ncbi:anaerobic NTP reductase large subunit [Serratia phage vB_SspM_LC53]|nr:anaerobic NTP reductase large subunit [Serratia phage vB_SspM_LC53]
MTIEKDILSVINKSNKDLLNENTNNHCQLKRLGVVVTINVCG